MSDELRLPDDLAAMEARLAAHAPPASGVNRDALMYRAGWAACEAQRKLDWRAATSGIVTLRSAAGSSPDCPAPSIPVETASFASRGRASYSGRIAAWSCASSAVAAALAVAVTLVVQAPLGIQVVEHSPASAVAPAAESAPPGSPAADRRNSAAVAAYLAVFDDAWRRPFSGPLFVVARRSREAVRQSAPHDSVAADDPAPTPKTARELQQEFLPTGNSLSRPTDQPSLGWPWNAHLWGKTI